MIRLRLCETWKPICVEWFSEIYEVSNRGRVRTVDRYIRSGRGNPLRFYRGAICALQCDPDMYLGVWLNYKGKTKVMRVHRLVALSFISNPNNLDTVDHINKIRCDNRVSNLRWMSVRDNIRRGQEQNIRRGRIRQEHFLAKERTCAPFSVIDPKGKEHTVHALSSFACKHNLDPAGLCAIKYHRQHSHRGWTLLNALIDRQSAAKLLISCTRTEKVQRLFP